MFNKRILLRIESAINSLTASVGIFEVMMRGIQTRIGYLEKLTNENSLATARLIARLDELEATR